MTRRFVVGSRGSALARRQTELVIVALQRLDPRLHLDVAIISTRGDRDHTTPLAEIGARGLFTTDIEQALLSGQIDLAVHSLKDLPADIDPRLALGAILERADARDCLVSRHGLGLLQLPPMARVGTSSLRRGAQALARRPDLRITPLRGNVDSRLHKAQTEEYDALILAAAGIIRLGRAAEITEYLSFTIMLPDAGQGALAVEARRADGETLAMLAGLEHAPTRAAVTAERAFLRALGGGCAAPVGVYGQVSGGALRLDGLVAAEDGAAIVRGHARGAPQQAEELGVTLARQLFDNGADVLLDPHKGGHAHGPARP